MEMSFSHIHVHPSYTAVFITLFCIFWPFVVIGFLPRRTTSTAPILAVLVPLGLVVFAIWRGVYRTFLGMAISGSRGAAVAAGLAEAFSLWFWALVPLVVIATASLIRRSRPAVDALTAVVAAVLLLVAAYALPFAAAPINQVVIIYIAMAVAILAALTAAIMLVRRRPGPFLRGAPIIAVVAFIAMTFVIWQQMQHYMTLATTRSSSASPQQPKRPAIL